jgi:outer membrane murein-binding lipoprotein Lpp
MKTKQTLNSLMALIISIIILAGCQNSADKEREAKEKLQKEQKELVDAQAKAEAELKESREKDEWVVLQKEAELQVKSNELAIIELKVKLNKPGTIMDKTYAKRIDDLEASNVELRNRIKDYKREQSDWQSFKREWNHDMEKLSQDIKNLTVDNAK